MVDQLISENRMVRRVCCLLLNRNGVKVLIILAPTKKVVFELHGSYSCFRIVQTC